MVGEASDDGAAKQPFCVAATVLLPDNNAVDAFVDEIFVDDSCSFKVFISFSANVAL